MCSGTEKTISKENEIKTKIKEIIGMDENQFRQIVMLAQGNFQKLLLSKTTDRLQILRNIFGTEIYDKFQKRISEKTKEIKQQAENARKKINEYIAGIICDEKITDLNAKLINAKEHGAVPSEIEEIISLINSGYSRDVEKFAGKESALQQEMDSTSNAIGRLKHILEIKQKYEQGKETLMQKEPALSAAAKALDCAKNSQPEIEGLAKTINLIEEKLPEYEKIQEILSKISETNKSIEKNSADLEAKKKEKKKIEEETENLKKEKESLSGAEKMLFDLKIEKNNCEEKKKQLESLKKDLVALAAIDAGLKQAAKTAQEAETLFRKKEEVVLDMRKAYLSGQAGLLAENMQEGTPCPVCGSLEHPKKAKKSEKVPTEAELNQSETEAESARNASDSKKEKFMSLKVRHEESRKAAETKIKELLGDFSPENAGNETDSRISAEENNISRLKAEIMKAESLLNRETEIDKKIPQLEKQKECISQEISSYESMLSSEKTDIRNLQNQHEEKRKNLNYDDKLSAENALKKACEDKKKLENGIKQAEEHHKTLQNEVMKLKGQIEANKQSLSGNEDAEYAEALAKHEDLYKEKAAVSKNIQEIKIRISANEKALQAIKKESANSEAMLKKLQWAEILSDTANGTVNAQHKISLETYALTSYLDLILCKANVHLSSMCGGKFELKRAEAERIQGKTGLDFSIIDHYNGSERSVETLSGGETFMASLSLALGLSETIQEQAGGIQTDTLFVDEGFGSLDEYSLGNAKKALLRLTEGNRLVGIISHVSALKDSIERRIVVSKQRTGGSIAKIEV